jgi:HK97 family phage major capsid protein
MPRKNGRSSESSGVGIYCLSADGEEGMEVYSGGTTRDQAKIVWQDAWHMVERSPELKEAFGVSTTAHAIRQVATASRFQALSVEGNSPDGLISAKYALKAQYQKSARWIFHRDAVAQVRKLKDKNDQYLWQPGLVADKPDTILELPSFMSEYAPNTFTTGKYAGIIGDFSFYWIADSMEFSIQVLKELYAESNQVGYIGRMECDAQPVLSEAFVRVKLA